MLGFWVLYSILGLGNGVGVGGEGKGGHFISFCNISFCLFSFTFLYYW